MSTSTVDMNPDVKYWMGEIKKALKREKDFRAMGRKVSKLYEGEDKEKYQYNILFSNTETLAPALYNSVPRPVVKRRFGGGDQLGKIAAGVAQRTLAFLLDTDQRDYSTFDTLMQSAVLEALVPGRGLTRFRYEAEFEEAEASNNSAEEGAESRVTSEMVCGERVSWDRFLFGYAKEWKDVPWIAFELPMSKAELAKAFGKEILKDFSFTNIENPTAEEEHRVSDSETDGAWVYEIWDKVTRKVYFISENYKKDKLKEIDDPLGLSGFFPVPMPLMLTKRITSLIPVAPYTFYEEQAEELNRITVRINKIIHALKVRGMYDSTVEGIDRLMAADDNTLIPAENVASLQQGQTLEKALFLMPIEKLVAVLQQLYAQRQEIKQVIFEITGIADIMRGSSQASETLGAQELKNQWGTLRLKKAQKEVQRYARDCLRIMAEIAMTKFSPDMIKAMTESPLLTGVEKQQVMMQVQQLQAYNQQIPPQLIQAAQGPSLDDALAVLKDDLQRSYRIDIETNSTVDAEATEDKQDMAELMNAIAQFMNGVAPAVEQGILPFEAAKGLLLGIVQKFRFGDDVEDTIKGMQPPQKPQGPDPKQLEQQQKQIEQQQAQLDKASQDLQLQQRQFEQDKQFASREIDQQKKFAQKELDFQANHAAREADMNANMVDQQLQFKQDSFQQQVAAQLKDLEAKMAQLVQQEATEKQATEVKQQETTSNLMQQMAQMMNEGFSKLAAELQGAMEAQAAKPKRAKKLADGTWTTF